MLERTIETIGQIIQDELAQREAELFKLLDREEKISISASIGIEGRPVELKVTLKMSWTLEKRSVLREEMVSETQQELFPQGAAVKAKG